MIPLETEITTVAHVIQTAIAPVFMLTGISSLLGVITNRLSRVVDRSRLLEKALYQVEEAEHEIIIKAEMLHLLKRGKLINAAIIFATSSELFICLVIIALFLGSFLSSHLSNIVTVLFISCMLFLSAALAFFLLEVSISTNNMRKGLAKAESLIYFKTLGARK